MNFKSVNARWILLALMVFAAALTRLIPHAFSAHFFNFSPIAAMALFGAAYFKSKETAFLLPFLALWLSNLLLDNLYFSQYYDGFAWFSNWEVYFAFALVVVLGLVALGKVTPLRLVGASLSSSVLFFLVTNFFVWFSGTMYPKTGEGLLACYAAAIPFFQNTVAGDLIFVAVMFGSFEWAKRRFPALRPENA